MKTPKKFFYIYEYNFQEASWIEFDKKFKSYIDAVKYLGGMVVSKIQIQKNEFSVYMMHQNSTFKHYMIYSEKM